MQRPRKYAMAFFETWQGALSCCYSQSCRRPRRASSWMGAYTVYAPIQEEESWIQEEEEEYRDQISR